MKRVLALSVLVGAIVAVAAVAGTTQSASAKPTAGSLVGTGASFPFPLISKWIPAVDQAYGIKVTYSPTGSSAGIAGITARTVDFGASDAPLSPDQLTACKGCVVIPWALAGTSIPYNLPGLNKRLRLSGPVIAQMYLGEITNWSDNKIKALNPGVNLPDQKVVPVFRSDGSGTTYNFTEYLSSVSPAWKSKVGFNTTVNFPAGTGARGSSGVAGVVKTTAGALTYVDAAYSIKNKFTMAAIQNRAGAFVLPGIKQVKAAVEATVPKVVKTTADLKIVDPPKSAGKLAYPISTFTYVIAATTSGDKAADLRKFTYWAITQGQKFSIPLLFVPLPNQVQVYAGKQIRKIQA